MSDFFQSSSEIVLAQSGIFIGGRVKPVIAFFTCSTCSIDTKKRKKKSFNFQVSTRTSLVDDHLQNLQKQPPEVSVRKGVLKNFAKFTGKHLYQSLFLSKVPGLQADSNTSVFP